jgi:hypothetical protein
MLNRGQRRSGVTSQSSRGGATRNGNTSVQAIIGCIADNRLRIQVIFWLSTPLQNETSFTARPAELQSSSSIAFV